MYITVEGYGRRVTIDENAKRIRAEPPGHLTRKAQTSFPTASEPPPENVGQIKIKV